VVDSIVSGGLRVAIGGGQGARLTLERSSHPPAQAPVALPRFVSVPASTLPGRDHHVAAAVRAVARWRPLGFFGPPGYGRTTLLRHLTRLLADHQPDGAVVALRLRDGRVDDLLQRLLTAIYQPARPVHPPEPERARLLARAESIVVLDDVALGPGALAHLAGALPRCMLILGARRKLAGLDCDWMRLGGLPEDDAADIVRSELQQAQGEVPHEHVVRLCRALGGHPLRLRLASALVRDLGAPLDALADRAGDDPSIVERLSLQVLEPPERQVLAVLALAPGTPVPGELVAAMSGVDDPGHRLAVLGRRGLAQREEEGYALAPWHRENGRRELLGRLDTGDALRALAGWLEQRPITSAKSRAASDACMAMIALAGEQGDWATVIRLVGGIEPVLGLTGRWEAWGDTLEQGLQAARTSGDRFAEADFAHQLGTLKLCLGEAEEARELLTGSLRARRGHGDERAVAVTSHNLALSRDSGLARLGRTLRLPPGRQRLDDLPLPARPAAAPSGEPGPPGGDPTMPAADPATATGGTGRSRSQRRRSRRRRTRRAQAAHQAGAAPATTPAGGPDADAAAGDGTTPAAPRPVAADAVTTELSAREIRAGLARPGGPAGPAPRDAAGALPPQPPVRPGTTPAQSPGSAPGPGGASPRPRAPATRATFVRGVVPADPEPVGSPAADGAGRPHRAEGPGSAGGSDLGADGARRGPGGPDRAGPGADLGAGGLSPDEAVAELQAFRTEESGPPEEAGGASDAGGDLGPAAGDHAGRGARPVSRAGQRRAGAGPTAGPGPGVDDDRTARVPAAGDERPLPGAAAAAAGAERPHGRFVHAPVVPEASGRQARGAADRQPTTGAEPPAPAEPVADEVGPGAGAAGGRSWWRRGNHARILTVIAGLVVTVLLVVLAVTSPDARSEGTGAITSPGGRPAAPDAALPPGGGTRSAAPAAAGAWSAAATRLDFGRQPVGRAGRERIVSIRNGSRRAGAIVAITVSGGGGGDFRAASRCTGLTLAAGGRCGVAVRFTPGAARARQARLRISVTGPPRQIVVLLHGTGVAG